LINNPMEEPAMEEQVWAKLAQNAERNFGQTGFSKILRIADYDPTRETHNFDNVVFDAHPSWYTPLMLTGLAWAVSRKPFGLDKRIVKPFESQIDEICERRERGKLMVITGHQIIFEPAFALLGLQKAVSRHTGESYAEVARETSVFVARAMAPVDILRKWPLTSLGRQLADVYYTLPRTDSYVDVPEEFLRRLNMRTLIEFARRNAGSGRLVAMSASATEEKRNERGEYVVNRITGDERSGTMGLLMKGWDILPVGGNYKHDLVVEPGKIIPAKDATPEIMHAAMKDVIVASRLRHGIQAVYPED
jgi:hypothetical protein